MENKNSVNTPRPKQDCQYILQTTISYEFSLLESFGRTPGMQLDANYSDKRNITRFINQTSMVEIFYSKFTRLEDINIYFNIWEY